MEEDPAWIPLQKAKLNDEPTDFEIKCTDKLVEFINASGVMDTEESMKHRKEVIDALNSHVDKFVEAVVTKNKVPLEEGEVVKGRLFYSGSYKLNVCSPTSDVDTVCVAPHFVKKEDFFSVLVGQLESDSNCKELIKVEDAFVPIIKMTYMGVDVDMSFAAINEKTVADDVNFNSDTCLENLHILSIRALNSLRVNNMILGLIPNRENFTIMLRFLRYWAKKRGIYGNVFGYFGGVNLAILCAFICQQYPKSSPAMLIYFFFMEFSNWDWPTPVYINTPNRGEIEGWSATKSPYDCMPIITPAYPSSNSLRSATISSRERIKDEMKRGFEMMEDILTGKKTWSKLASDHSFFIKFRTYIMIQFSAETATDYNWWSGCATSKLRRLISGLEEMQYIVAAPPFPSSFDRRENGLYVGSVFIGVKTEVPKDAENKQVDVYSPVKRYLEEVLKTQKPLSCAITQKIMKRDDIPDWTFPGGVKPKKHTKSKKPSKSSKK